MAFPVHLLSVERGHIEGYLFENPSMRISLGITWSFAVTFAPIWYDGEEVSCSLAIEWLEIPVRDWRELSHKSFKTPVHEILATFCVWEHESAHHTELRIGKRTESHFDIEWTSWVDFSGGAPDDRDPNLLIETSARLPFVGIGVHHELVQAHASPASRAEVLLARFVDRDCFGELEFWQRPGFAEGYFLTPE